MERTKRNELGRFDVILLTVWFIGIFVSFSEYLLAVYLRDIRILDTVFWCGMLFFGWSLGTFGHISITYFGSLLRKEVKRRYNRYFDVLYQQDVENLTEFIELISDDDVARYFVKFRFYRILSLVSLLLFALNVVIGRFFLVGIMR